MAFSERAPLCRVEDVPLVPEAQDTTPPYLLLREGSELIIPGLVYIPRSSAEPRHEPPPTECDAIVPYGVREKKKKRDGAESCESFFYKV